MPVLGSWKLDVEKMKSSIDILKAKILEKCENDLPDYEVPKYVECIEKIPYKNTKHNFKELEAMGEEYVKKLRG